MKIKSIFHHFLKAFIKANKINCFEGESPSLSKIQFFAVSIVKEKISLKHLKAVRSTEKKNSVLMD